MLCASRIFVSLICICSQHLVYIITNFVPTFRTAVRDRCLTTLPLICDRMLLEKLYMMNMMLGMKRTVSILLFLKMTSVMYAGFVGLLREELKP